MALSNSFGGSKKMLDEGLGVAADPLALLSEELDRMWGVSAPPKEDLESDPVRDLSESYRSESLRKMSDEELMARIQKREALKAAEQERQTALRSMSNEELMARIEARKKSPMGALEYLRKSAEAKGVVWDGDTPDLKKSFDATLMALTPFFDKAMRYTRSNEIGGYVDIAKGKFNLGDPSIRERYRDSFIPYYNGAATLDDVKKDIQETALRQAIDRSEQLQRAQQEIENRGTTTMGTVFGKGAEIVGQASEMAVPGGLGGKFLVGAGTEAAARYAEHANGKIGYDENGNPVILDGDSAGKAAGEALLGGMAQSGIELLGGKVLGKVWGATGGKLIGKAAGTAAGQKVAENSIVKGVGKITNLLKTPLEVTGWSGMPGEIGEEFMQGATDAYFGLDTTDAEERGTTAGGRFKEFAGNFFKGENLADLAESMLLMQAIGGGSAYLQKRHSNQQLNKIITEKIGGVSENVLNNLSPEEKARIVEAHYQGLSAEEAADIINKGAGALDKFIIEKQTEATQNANGRAMLAEMNPEAADAIRAARREGKDISRKMIRDLGLSEKILGDVESRNKFGDALLENGRRETAKNAAKMDGQQEMALRQEIAGFVGDGPEAQRVYDRVTMKLKDASVLDDPYQREKLVMQAAEAVWDEDQAQRVGGARQKARMAEKADHEARVAEAEAQAAEQAEVERARQEELALRQEHDDNERALARENLRYRRGVKAKELAEQREYEEMLLKREEDMRKAFEQKRLAEERAKEEARLAEERAKTKAGQEERAKREKELAEYEEQEKLRIQREIEEERAPRIINVAQTPIENAPDYKNRMEEWPEYAAWIKRNGLKDSDKNWNKFVAKNDLDPNLKVDRGRNAKGGQNETRANETQPQPEQTQPVVPPAGETARSVEAGEAQTKVGREVEASKTAAKAPTSASTETKINTLPTTTESAEDGSDAADAVSTPAKPKTVREGKAFVNSNIGKRYTDGKKTYEITGLTKDGEVSVKVTDKIGKSSEATLKLSGALTRIFGTKNTNAVWSEVEAADLAKKSSSRTKSTAETTKAEQTVPKTEIADKKPAATKEFIKLTENDGKVYEVELPSIKIPNTFHKATSQADWLKQMEEVGKLGDELRAKTPFHSVINKKTGNYYSSNSEVAKQRRREVFAYEEAVRRALDKAYNIIGEENDSWIEKNTRSSTPKSVIEKAEVADKKTTREAKKAEVKKPIKPIKANPQKAAAVVKEFASKDAKRGVLQTVHHDHDSGVTVATNGSVLIATKHGYDPNYKMNPDNPYPNWKQVVPNYDKEAVTFKGKKEPIESIKIDPHSVAEACATAKRIATGIGVKNDVCVSIPLANGTRILMNADNMQKVAKAMSANGITEIKAPSKTASPIVAKNADTTIVAMPLRDSDSREWGKAKRGRANGNFIEIDATTGKLLSAPIPPLGDFPRKKAEDLRKFIENGRKAEIKWLRTTDLYKSLIAAQKNGETDAKKVYEGATAEGSWDNLSEDNKKLFAELLATKDTTELENKFARYSAKQKDSQKQSPLNDWVERDPKELAKLEKEIAAEDEIDSLMADAEPKTEPKPAPKSEPKAEINTEAKVEPKSETAPSITPAEAMKKLGTLGAADVDTLSKALAREERAGHTERANMIRVLRDYKRGVGTNTNPESDETSGGKYRASVEAAEPLDDPAFVAWAKKRGVAPTTQKRNEYDKAMADMLKNRLSRWIKGVSVKTVNFIAPEEGGDIKPIHDGERIVGSYNRATGEVKLAKGASVETVLHELGWHAARHWAEVNADSDTKAANLLTQMKVYAESAPKEIKDAVRDVYGDLDADTLLDEIGAARFTKEQSGKIAKAVATKEGTAWYQKVWSKVVDFYKNFLTKAGYNRVDLDGVENMSPEVFGDFLADVMMSGKQLGERTAFSMEAPKGFAAKWTKSLSDYKAPIAELEKRVIGSSNNIYYLARTLEGQAQRGKNRAERAIRRVEKVLGDDVSPELLAQYMQLKAYEERNAKIERRNGKADASGMTPEDAKAIEKTIKDSGVDEAVFEEAAQILWDLQREGLQARVDAGLLDQETANKWMTDEPHHIPWKDAIDPDSGEYVGRKMGASEFDTAEGRKTAASGDPITWMLQEYQDAMTRAAQNRLRSAIANLTRLNGDVGTIYDGIQTDTKGKRSFIKYPIDGGKAKVLSIPEGVKVESTVKNDGGMQNVLTFKEGGETKYLVLNGTLGEAVAGAVTGRTLSRPPAWISWVMRGYAATATSLSPAFAARNITADNFDIHNNLIAKYGWVKGEKMFAKIVKEQFLMTKQLGSYIKNGDFKLDKDGKVTDFQKLVEAYEGAGGLVGGMATEGYEATVKKIQADFRAGRNKVRSIGKSVAGYWMMMQKMSELAPRLAVFKTAMESGMSAKEAAMLSRDLTVDFNKKGEKTPWFNTLWMFSNSALGANLTQMKGLVGKTGAKLAGGLVMYGFAEGLLEALMNGDDDEREKEGLASGKDINEYTRQNSLYIRRGDKVFRVNIHMGPFAYAKYFGNVMARTFSGMIPPEKAAKELGLTAAEVAASFTGLGNVSGDALVQTAVPTIVQPFAQMATNKDYAGRAVYRTKFTESKPDSAHGRKSTAAGYHWVASLLNSLTGGNEARKGAIDIAPETVKMLTETVGKNFARDIMEIAETGYKLLSDNTKDLDVRNVPFAGDFARTHEGNDNRFYENYNRYRDDKYELKKNSKLKGDDRRAYLKEHPWLYSAGKPGVTRIDNIVKRIEKLRDVEESDRATEERKAEAKAARRKLQARVIEIMKGK